MVIYEIQYKNKGTWGLWKGLGWRWVFVTEQGTQAALDRRGKVADTEYRVEPREIKP